MTLAGAGAGGLCSSGSRLILNPGIVDDDARASATWTQQPRHAHYFWRVKSDVGLSVGRGAGAGGGGGRVINVF